VATADEYLKELSDRGLDKISIGWDTVAEAKTGLAQLRQKQAELRQIKKRINLDMSQVRASYQQKMASAGSGGAAVFSLFGKRRSGSSYRADAKRRLRAERDRVLRAYSDIKVAIDDALLQGDAAKLQLQQWIEENK